MSYSLSDTANIWSAIAALFAIAFAWFTYAKTAARTRKRTYSGLSNLITGIEKEMELIWEWAGPDNRESGHLKAKSEEEYFEDKCYDWGNPTRTIEPFGYPAIKSLTSSVYVHFLGPIINDFVMLNYSIVYLYHVHSEYRKFAFSDPALFHSVSKKVASAKKNRVPLKNMLNKPEFEYMMRIFKYNYKLHVERIGDKDADDNSHCLFKTYTRARQSLKCFRKKHLRAPETLPRWYWIGHIATAIFAIVAFIFLFDWLGLTHVIIPAARPVTPEIFPYW